MEVTKEKYYNFRFSEEEAKLLKKICREYQPVENITELEHKAVDLAKSIDISLIEFDD